jgi:hypothetical protein
MDALLAYSDDDDSDCGGLPSAPAAAALPPPPPAASNPRAAQPKPAGVVIFKLPSMRSAAADDDDSVPPPPQQPEDAGAKRPRGGDRRSAFLSSLPAPKNAAATPALIPAAGAAASASASASASAAGASAGVAAGGETCGPATAVEQEFEVDSAAYSEDDSSSGSPPASAAPQLHADDDAPALGPSYPPPDYYALAYPEVGDDSVAEEREMDYSNAMFDQSVPVEGAVLCQPPPQRTAARACPNHAPSPCPLPPPSLLCRSSPI